MIGAMTRRAVLVNPARGPGKQPVEGSHQIRVGAGTQLHDYDSGRGMRDEDDEEAVALAGDEPFAGIGQIVQPAVTPCLDRQLGDLQ